MKNWTRRGDQRRQCEQEVGVGNRRRLRFRLVGQPLAGMAWPFGWWLLRRELQTKLAPAGGSRPAPPRDIDLLPGHRPRVWCRRPTQVSNENVGDVQQAGASHGGRRVFSPPASPPQVALIIFMLRHW